MQTLDCAWLDDELSPQMTDTEKAQLPSFLHLSFSPSGSFLILQEMTLSGKEPGTALMLLVLIFLHASQGLCLLSSALENTGPHARCGERRPHKPEKLFLCFLLAAAATQCGGSTRWCLDKERAPRCALSLTKRTAENH